MQRFNDSHDCDLVFLGSGGLFHEMKIMQEILNSLNIRVPDRVVLVDPIYSSSSQRSHCFQLALWEFSRNLKRASELKQHNIQIKVLKKLDDIWPIQRATKFLFIGIDPTSEVQCFSSDYFPALYRSMLAISKLIGFDSYDSFIVKGNHIYDKHQLLRIFSPLPLRYLMNPEVNYQVVSDTHSSKPVLTSYHGLESREFSECELDIQKQRFII